MNLTAPNKISEIIRELVEDYGKDGVSPTEINNGHCADIVHCVWENMDRDPRIQMADNEEMFGALYSHSWIVFEGKHYDAEAPEGVEHPKDLPFFKRHPGDLKPFGTS